MTLSFKTCCIFKKQVLIDFKILQIRRTSMPTFVENLVYTSIIFFFCYYLIQPRKLSSNLIIWLARIKLRCRTITVLHVLMFKMTLLRVYCSYSHNIIYILLLETGTEIHAWYVNILYDPRWRKHGITIIDTLMQDCICGILKILVIHVWHCFVILFLYFSSSVNAKNSTAIIRWMCLVTICSKQILFHQIIIVCVLTKY